ncbi:hypothetical protein EW145_g5085 [Phellinidium pouzarii]|uniref:Uncharacterized protein n=1 Tax=Phellinidium pouzarii TaxID=167371 RepID=A0A4S4L630_9AGAM|nr:hypothetical protein EW145_g5085 [Phellinidium pouzarii]
MDPAQFGVFMGSVLVASWFATALSGVMLLQAYIYYRNRPKDDGRVFSALVVLLLTLDMAHVACIMATLYHYLIQYFGDDEALLFMVPPLALTVGLTGTITFFAQGNTLKLLHLAHLEA